MVGLKDELVRRNQNRPSLAGQVGTARNHIASPRGRRSGPEVLERYRWRSFPKEAIEKPSPLLPDCVSDAGANLEPGKIRQYPAPNIPHWRRHSRMRH
jgi:hypothetical protein